MPDIYNVNAENIVGGPGRLIVKPWDGEYPVAISEVMDLNAPYTLVGNYRDLGATTEGIAVSRSFETEEFTVDQVSGPVDTDITGWTQTLSTNLAENTVENRQLALVGGTIMEQAPLLGASTTAVTPTAAGGTLLNVLDPAEFNVNGFLQVNGQTFRITAVEGNTITLDRAVAEEIPAESAVYPVEELGSRRIGYGAPTQVPFFTVVLISQKKDGTLYMAVFRKCKVSGDDVEQTFGAEKRVLPLGLNAFPDGDAPEEESIYYEIEQML